jgi:uncharacterized membrane protein
MRTILFVHILAGGLGLVSGYVALYATKGATLHRKSGMLFVCVMTTMAKMSYWRWRLRVRRSARGTVRVGAVEINDGALGAESA